MNAAVAPTLVVGSAHRHAFATIGEALSTAPPGATISVAPGTYREAIYINEVSATIVAVDFGTVTIDATALPYPSVSCTGGAVTLRGIVLTAGDAAVVAVDGGRLTMAECELRAGAGAGVKATNRSQLDLRNVTVHGGHSGLVIDDSTGVVAECEISDVAGDGIIVRHGADPVIRRCTVRDCADRGCYVYQFGRPVLEGCTFSDLGDAGIAVVHESAPQVRHCTVERTRGPGIAFGRGCAGTVEDCSFAQVGGVEVDVAEGARPEVGSTTGAGAGRGAPDGQHGVARLLAELDGMIGLPRVKHEVRTLIDEIQVNEWRRASGLAVGNLSHHLVFAGAPGTGKTTVARIYGRLLSAMKVLPTDTFVEVARQDLVAGYLGQTAAKTTEVFRSALGGVLFIDEAYALARTIGSGRDFGQEAIDTLVKLMEDHRDQIVVIAAGYTADMAEFLKANAGLASRFARVVEFENYTADQLVSIVGRIVAAADYALESPAGPLLRKHFAALPRDAAFGNAREARKLFEEVRKAQAVRLRQLGYRPGPDELRAITEEDLRSVLDSA